MALQVSHDGGAIHKEQRANQIDAGSQRPALDHAGQPLQTAAPQQAKKNRLRLVVRVMAGGNPAGVFFARRVTASRSATDGRYLPG